MSSANPGSAPAPTNAGPSQLGGSAGNWGIPVTVVVIAVLDFIAIAFHEHSPVWRCLAPCCKCLKWRHWPVFFVSNMRDGIDKHTRPQTWWAFDVLDPVHLVTSFCVPSWVLLLLHIFCFFYFVVYVLLDVCLYYPKPGSPENPYWQWLTYLTNWSIMFYALASLVAAVNTLRFLLNRRRIPQDTGVPPVTAVPAVTAVGDGTGSGPANGASVQPVTAVANGTGQNSFEADGQVYVYAGDHANYHHPIMRWDWLNIAHLLLMEVFTTAAWFVGFWFWVGIVVVVGTGTAYNEATTYMPHGGTAILAALQICLTRMPIVSNHFPVLVLYANCYFLLLWIYGSVSGVWRYDLDWHYARPVAAYILVIPILFIMFTLWYVLAKLRRSCCISLRGFRNPPIKYNVNHRELPTGRVHPAGMPPAGPSQDVEMWPAGPAATLPPMQQAPAVVQVPAVQQMPVVRQVPVVQQAAGLQQARVMQQAPVVVEVTPVRHQW